MGVWFLAGAAAAVAGWLAAPWVSMARRGTVDQRAVASWAATTEDPPVDVTPVDIPSPREADDAPASHPPDSAVGASALSPAPEPLRRRGRPRALPTRDPPRPSASNT